MDGTLITSKGAGANKLHKRAFSAAFKDVFDIDTDIDIIQHHGSTDTLILVAVLERHGIPKETVWHACNRHHSLDCLLCNRPQLLDHALRWVCH